MRRVPLIIRPLVAGEERRGRMKEEQGKGCSQNNVIPNSYYFTNKRTIPPLAMRGIQFYARGSKIRSDITLPIA